MGVTCGFEVELGCFQMYVLKIYFKKVIVNYYMYYSQNVSFNKWNMDTPFSLMKYFTFFIYIYAYLKPCLKPTRSL